MSAVNAVNAMNERLGSRAAVKGTLFQSHLGWVAERLPGGLARLEAHLPEECRVLIVRGVLATEWVPFRCLVALDRTIAALRGTLPDQVYRELGRYSAEINLGGVYKAFAIDEPHRFFAQMALLHSRFQTFGRSEYEKTGDRSGRIRIQGCDEYSPVFCTSGLGYYEGTLLMMKVPGPVRAAEAGCQCVGDACCLYELAW